MTLLLTLLRKQRPLPRVPFFARNSSTSNVRVRFAPSPTGKLHLGGLRTALLNYLFARKHRGEFLLRIEDTDQERYKVDALANLMASLEWVGIQPTFGPNNEGGKNDGGPWFQSKRLDLYHEQVRVLLEKRHAYYCFCDEARLALMKKNAMANKETLKYDGRCWHLKTADVERFLAEKRPHVIRFRLPSREVAFHDMITGLHKSTPSNQEGDFVIVKSDKYPTYHFANVIDDHFMRITHVLRGIEWQVSTPKHILMYEAFGWQHPQYGHLPLIMNNDGSKLSKRQGDIDILSYRERGYFHETILAYLACIGSGFKEGRALNENDFNTSNALLQQLVELFDEKNFLARPVKLNEKLLNNLNKRFFQLKLKENRAQLLTELERLVRAKFKESNQTLNESYVSRDYLDSVLLLAADRIKNLKELVEHKDFRFLWHDLSNFCDTSMLKKEPTMELLESLIACLQNSKDTKSLDLLKQQLKAVIDELKLQGNNKTRQQRKENKAKELGPWELARLILIGLRDGPPVAEIISTLGRENSIYRLNIAKNVISKI